MSSILAGRDPSRVVEDDPLVSRVHVPMKKRGPRARLDCRKCDGQGFRRRGGFGETCRHCKGSGFDPES